MPIDIFANTHVLIAGPTASGKSALALQIAQTQGGIIVNADALQVFSCWQALSARPDNIELAQAEHALYGHVDYDATYSVGHWLADVKALLTTDRLIIVGGTGLYLSALTEGLAEIPQTPIGVRERANALPLSDLTNDLDGVTRGRIDIQNRVRVQRAWEVLQSTGRSIIDWQNATPPPILPMEHATGIVLDAPTDWLNPRIERRFNAMLEGGALNEVRAMMEDWDSSRPSSKAIGAPELMAYLRGDLTLMAAKEAAVISTRQYAKRQRTWFRKRMAAWHRWPVSSTDLSTTFTFHS